ncbi:MAG: outer membrane protein [Bradyrhizobium sp.]
MSATKLLVSGIALASALLVFGSQSASAADLPARVPAKAPVYVAPPFSWTGFYIGAHAGYHWGSDRTSTAANPVGWSVAGAADIDALTPGTVHPSGFMGGGQIGYNWQMNNFVVGIEADASYMGGTASRAVTGFAVINPADVFRTSAESRFFGTLRPRVGLAVDRALFYVTGGLAVTSAKFTDSFGSFANTSVAADSSDTTRAGWTAGVGMEYAFTNNWSAKAEYLYADFGNFTQSIPNCALCGVGSEISVTHKYTENIGRVGLNYKFGGPVVARY